MNSLQESMVPVASMRVTEQQGSSRLQGNLRALKVIWKAVVQEARVVKGIMVRQLLVDIWMERGFCQRLLQRGLREVVEAQVVLGSRNCHADTMRMAVEYPLPLKKGEGVTVREMVLAQEPALPLIFSWRRLLGLESTEMATRDRKVGELGQGMERLWRQVMALVLILMTPTNTSMVAEGVVQVLGMLIEKGLMDQLPGKTMSILSQARGYQGSRLICVPREQVKVVPVRAVRQGQVDPEVRVVKRLVHPSYAKTEMTLLSQDCTTFCQLALLRLTSRMQFRKLRPALVKSLVKQLAKAGSWFLCGSTMGVRSCFLTEEAVLFCWVVSWKQRWRRQEEGEVVQRNLRWLTTMEVGQDWGQMLQEVLEAMVRMERVELEVSEQGQRVALRRQDPAGVKEDEAVREGLVQMVRQDPAFVRKEGVMVKERELVLVCIDVSLLVQVEVRALTIDTGTAEAVTAALPAMRGVLIWEGWSMLAEMVNTGLAEIEMRAVMLMTDPEATVGNPEMVKRLVLEWVQIRLLVVTVEVCAQMVPYQNCMVSAVICSTKLLLITLLSWIFIMMYWVVEVQNYTAAEGRRFQAVQMVMGMEQLTVCMLMACQLASRGVMELQGRLYTEMVPWDRQEGVWMLEIPRLNCLPTENCSLKTRMMRLALMRVVERSWGGEPTTPVMVTREEEVKENPELMVKMSREVGVGHCTPIVICTKRLETWVAGRDSVMSLRVTICSMLPILDAMQACPAFQFSSIMTPVPLMTYISKLEEMAPIRGRMPVSICREQGTEAERRAVRPMTTVVGVLMLGLTLVTAVAFMVMDEADCKFTQFLTNMLLERRVQDVGVTVVKMGSTMRMYEVVGRGYCSWK